MRTVSTIDRTAMLEAYQDALKNCRKSMKNKETKMDAFDFSTFLAIAFGMTKEQTLDDLLSTKA